MKMQRNSEQSTERNDLLRHAAETARKYVHGIGQRRVTPTEKDLAALAKFREPFPNRPSDPMQVLDKLDESGSPATVATTGGRYFGFVIGGILPASLAANRLVSTWDQNAVFRIMSPVVAEIEEVVLRWVCEVFGIEPHCEGGIVTDATA